MEVEFLDLIQTFEKTTSRLEHLDGTILSFKGVVEGLRENLDELVEMVQLEQIVELAETSSAKLKALQQQIKEIEKLRMGDMKTYGLASPVSPTLGSDSQYLYELNRETGTLHILTKQQQAMPMSIEGLQLMKLYCWQQTVFALGIHGIYFLYGAQAQLVATISATDFWVRDYTVYFLEGDCVKKIHLLTKEEELVAEKVATIQDMDCGNYLVCQFLDDTLKVITS